MWWACQSASCDPREPMRRRAISSSLPDRRRTLPLLSFLLQVEQPAHQVDHRGGLGIARGRLQSADRGVHDLVHDAARERFDRQFLVGLSGPSRPRTRSISACRMVSR